MMSLLTPEAGEGWAHRQTGDEFRVKAVTKQQDEVRVEYIRCEYPRNVGSLDAFREAVRDETIERAPALGTGDSHDE